MKRLWRLNGKKPGVVVQWSSLVDNIGSNSTWTPCSSRTTWTHSRCSYWKDPWNQISFNKLRYTMEGRPELAKEWQRYTGGGYGFRWQEWTRDTKSCPQGWYGLIRWLNKLSQYLSLLAHNIYPGAQSRHLSGLIQFWIWVALFGFDSDSHYIGNPIKRTTYQLDWTGNRPY